MVGNSEKPEPTRLLRLKKGDGGARGEIDRCLSCGAPLAPADILCVKCGFDRRSARHLRTEDVLPPKVSRVGRFAFLGSLLVIILWLSALLGTGFGLYKGYAYYEREHAKATSRNAAAVSTQSQPQQRVCTNCRGQGKVKCATCGGFGTLETVVRAKCKHCDGSGKYTAMSKRGTAACPFCRGKGYTDGPGRQDCTACASKGWVSCSACAGKGVIVVPPPQ